MVDVPKTRVINVLDVWAVLDMIHAEIDRAGSQKALAQEWGISEQYLSDVLRRRRDPGNKILKRMKLHSMTVYLVDEPPVEWIE